MLNDGGLGHKCGTSDKSLSVKSQVLGGPKPCLLTPCGGMFERNLGLHSAFVRQSLKRVHKFEVSTSKIKMLIRWRFWSNRECNCYGVTSRMEKKAQKKMRLKSNGVIDRLWLQDTRSCVACHPLETCNRSCGPNLSIKRHAIWTCRRVSILEHKKCLLLKTLYISVCTPQNALENHEGK